MLLPRLDKFEVKPPFSAFTAAKPVTSADRSADERPRYTASRIAVFGTFPGNVSLLFERLHRAENLRRTRGGLLAVFCTATLKDSGPGTLRVQRFFRPHGSRLRASISANGSCDGPTKVCALFNLRVPVISCTSYSLAQTVRVSSFRSQSTRTLSPPRDFLCSSGFRALIQFASSSCRFPIGYPE